MMAMNVALPHANGQNNKTGDYDLWIAGIMGTKHRIRYFVKIHAWVSIFWPSSILMGMGG